MKNWRLTAPALTALFLLGFAPPALAVDPETNCQNQLDDDGDGLPDCGDADCADKPECAADGNAENTNARCSDYIDNDKNGHIDCDDDGCNSGLVTVCKGTWQGPLEGTGVAVTGEPGDVSDDMPELGEGQSVEDLLGTGSDKDGERNDQLCSDGIDNDADGRIDCADFGCRFDPEVKICQGNVGMRFSIVANVAAEYDFVEEKPDVAFTKVQLRTFGPIPLIQDSFYLLSLRAERTPRLTFAMFQFPVAKGHFLNINSGGGGLSNAAVLSTAKHILIDPPFYLTSPFDQGNSAALEFSGPVDDSGIARYRVYGAAGAGLSTGSVGGRYYGFDNENFTYGGGAAFQFNIFGTWSREGTEFMYTPAPVSWAVTVGGKYDQRAQEHYVAGNFHTVVRGWRFHFAAESFVKQEFAFDSLSFSYNVKLGVLLVEKYLLLAADFGEFIAGDMQDPPERLETELRRQLDETQFRVALHTYFFRNIGLASLLYTDRKVAPTDADETEPNRERTLKLEVQYRF